MDDSLMRTNPSLNVPLQAGCRTLGEVIGAAAEEFSERDAYVFGEQRLSFRAWIERADELAAGLAARGVRAGDVVALLLNTSLDYPIACAAVARLGAVITGINLRLSAREVDNILGICKPRLVICEDDVPLAADDFELVRRSELSKLHEGAPPIQLPRQVDETAPAVIIWTSGTTGTPKGAWFDHRNLRAHVATGWPMSAPFDRKLVSVPLVHAGYMSKFWEQAALAITVVLAPTPWNASTMLRLLSDERITSGGGVPTQLAKLLELPELDGTDLSALRVLVSAAAPATPELIEALIARIKCAVISRYAMTECPSISGTAPGDSTDVLLRTVGRPTPGTEIAMTDADGNPVAPGEVGTVRVRSDCVMRGYWNMPEATAAALTEDGWLISSDLARFDEHGNLRLAGRLSDMYIRGGYNVYPIEVENVLTEHPKIASASVVGQAAPVIGEIGVAFVAMKDDAETLSLESLRDWCLGRLADYKRPDRLIVIAEMPLTAQLKVDKNALRQRLADS